MPVKSFQLVEKMKILQVTTAKLREHFILGWTHYVTLLTMKNPEERRFYELEAAENGWGYRELKRQINSAPEFEATEDYMKVVVGKVSEKMSENEPKLSDKKPDSYPEVPDTPKNDVGKVSEKILALLTDTPNLNIARLAEELSVSSRTVERNLKKLQEQGMLERVGGKKTGSWKVLVK